jgi:hypothetical protein
MSRSFLESSGDVCLRIYGDESCSYFLKEYFIKIKITEEEPEYFEETMAHAALCEIEEEFPENWATAIFIDRGQGNTFYRNKHYLLDFDYEPKIPVVPRVIYFDVQDIELFRRIFSTAMIEEINLSSFNKIDSFIFGRNEYICRLVEALKFDGRFSYKNAFVIIANQEASESWYEITTTHKAKVHIDGGEHLRQLERLVTGFYLLHGISSVVNDALNTADDNKMDISPYEKIDAYIEHELLEIRKEFEAQYT